MKIPTLRKTEPNNRSFLCIVAFFIVFLCPVNAWALQSHPAPEGLYVHQMAHIFFIGALVYLFWDIKRTSFTGIGWRFLQAFCVLFFIWNITAFVGHWVALFLDDSAFDMGNGYWLSRLRYPLEPIRLTYYLTRMDHLVSMPALFFLMLSLRSFYKQAIKENER